MNTIVERPRAFNALVCPSDDFTDGDDSTLSVYMLMRAQTYRYRVFVNATCGVLRIR